MTPEQEFIRQAKLDWEDDAHKIETIKDALEACYMNGDYDEVGGDAEAPTGHYYQIENWTVVTDSQGNVFVNDWNTVKKAEEHFELLERDFSRWLKEQEGE